VLFEKILLAPTGASTHVHDDGVARPQRWDEPLFDIGQESVAIHGAVQNKRSDQTVGAQSSGECCRLPMSMWDGSTASLAAWRAPVKPHHFGVGAGFVDEDEALRVEIDLPSNQSSRAAFISPRRCSAACAVFF
jgi:hypothetical protein